MKLFLAALTVVGAACSFAQGLGPAPFTQVPGVHEFSGRLIVRPNPVSVLMKRGVTAAEAAVMRTKARADLTSSRVRWIKETDETLIQVPAGKTENQVAVELMATGLYQYVEPDWTLYPVATPNDPQYGSQYHLPRIEANWAWDMFTAANTSTIVAITDTGVRITHQDLAARVVPGANSAGASVVPQASGGLVDDINGHGTHCAGIAGASGNNSLGVSGASWGMRIMPVRVTNSTGGSASLTSLTSGARWAADNGAKVVSTSYSGVSSASVQTTGAYLRTKGTLYFWAAGNSNTNMTGFDHADVNIIGASDSADARASFSNYGTPIDLFAPGVNILATLRTSNTSYGNMSGTSMACPLAAGSAALLAASNPRITTQQVENALYSTAQDLGTAGNDSVFGWGRINVNRALRQLYQTVPFEAVSATLVAGGTPSGAVGDLWSSDNAYWQATFDQTGTVELRFTPTNQIPGSLQLTLEDNVSQDATRAISYVVGSTVTPLSGSTLSVGPDGTTNVNLPLAALSGGQVVVRVNYSVFSRTGARSLTAKLDRATLLAAP